MVRSWPYLALWSGTISPGGSFATIAPWLQSSMKLHGGFDLWLCSARSLWGKSSRTLFTAAGAPPLGMWKQSGVSGGVQPKNKPVGRGGGPVWTQTYGGHCFLWKMQQRQAHLKAGMWVHAKAVPHKMFSLVNFIYFYFLLLQTF